MRLLAKNGQIISVDGQAILAEEPGAQLTGDTVTSSVVLQGYTFHNANGEADVGIMSAQYDSTNENIILPEGLVSING